ncbi:MAG TPA: IPT/TIG domain-containing protein, partial [Bacteroidales bacterium]|nr:IPT/TIG domain-containing protein [Bacteroidales bacterium]
MKIMNNILRTSVAVLAVILAVTACKETGDILIDPVEYDTLFTFSPTHGFPGSTIQIKGRDLSGVTLVAFGSVEGDISSQAAGTISAIVPVGAQTAKIKLVKSGLVVTSMTNFIVDPEPIPTVIDFTPAIAGSGDLITITGNLLDQVDSVFIGNLKAVISGTPTAGSMQIIAPAGLQTGKIRLFYTYLTSYGMLKPAESASSLPLSLALPVIESITPNIMTLNIGDEVVVTGTMLDEVTKVEFGTIEAAPFTYADGTLTFLVPAGATTGKIKLTHADGFTESGTFQINLPAISLFLPDKGAEGASTEVRAFTIDGTNLDLVTSVTVGVATATIQTQTATKLIFTVPGNNAGFISLVSLNGTVRTSIPFFFTGSMWLADYDNMYTPVRLFNEPMYAGVGGSESFQDADAITKSIGNNGDAYGNFRRFAATFKTTGSPRLYVRADQGADANPVPDRFLLYTPNSQGVTFDFDVSWDAIP